MGGAEPEGKAASVIDTHAFAFSPIFLKENRLPEEMDGTLDALVQDMDRAGVGRTLCTFFVTKQDDTFATVASGLARHRGRVAAQLYLAANHADFAAANVRSAASDLTVAGARAAPSLFKLHPVDESLEKVWDACQAARLPVQLVVDASTFCEPSTFAILARQRPELTLVLSVTRARNRAELSKLARFPRVFFQLPGLLDAEIKGGDPAMLRWASKNIPPMRLMFGSDRLGKERSYFAKVKALSGLPARVQDPIAWQTAAEVYGARLPAWRSP